MITAATLMLLTQSASTAFADDRSAILALREANNQAIAAHDVAGIMAIAAEDYALVASGGKIARSKAEATEIWTKAPRQCVRTPQSIEIGAVQDQMTAAESGQWRCLAAEGGSIGGSYFAHWRKGEQGWRVTADVYVPLAKTPED